MLARLAAVRDDERRTAFHQGRGTVVGGRAASVGGGVGRGVGEPSGAGVPACAGLDGDGAGVWSLVIEGVRTLDGLLLAVEVSVAVIVGVGVRVKVGVAVAVGVSVGVLVGVGVGVRVGVQVAVAVGVGVVVSVGMAVRVGAAVGDEITIPGRLLALAERPRSVAMKAPPPTPPTTRTSAKDLKYQRIPDGSGEFRLCRYSRSRA